MLTRRKLLGIAAGLPLLGGLFGRKEEKQPFVSIVGSDFPSDDNLLLDKLRERAELLVGNVVRSPKEARGKQFWRICFEWFERNEKIGPLKWFSSVPVYSTDPSFKRIRDGMMFYFPIMDSKRVTRQFALGTVKWDFCETALNAYDVESRYRDSTL